MLIHAVELSGRNEALARIPSGRYKSFPRQEPEALGGWTCTERLLVQLDLKRPFRTPMDSGEPKMGKSAPIGEAKRRASQFWMARLAGI